MAQFKFRLPDIGEGIAEAEIVQWHVAVGDRIEEDANLADMMTDKATVEMESPVSGIVVELAGEVGDMVPIGSTLAVIEVDAEEADDAAGATGEAQIDVPAAHLVAVEPLAAAPVSGEVADRMDAENSDAGDVDRVEAATKKEEGQGFDKLSRSGVGESASTKHRIPAPVEALPSSSPQRQTLASPAVRARATDLGVDLAHVKPGEDGRLRHADLDAYLRYNASTGFGAPQAPRADEQVRVIGMRRRIAENMAASKRAIPHFTYVEEIEVTRLEELRADLNANRGARPKLTMLPLLITAICRALPEYPMINARYDDADGSGAGVVNRSGAVHLGMATQTDAGLTVPVIRDAHTKNVWQLATEIVRLADAARAGKATSAEMSGGTLTITSLGPLGGIATTPVINRPEVAIIGPNRIVERPVFTGRGDEVRRAKLMNLSISCDHRVVDGWDAASFVQAVKQLIETPVLLFAD